MLSACVVCALLYILFTVRFQFAESIGYNRNMHDRPLRIGVLTHNYPRFPGDFSGTFVEALCEEMAAQEQRVTVWAPYDDAYDSAYMAQRSAGPSAVDLHLYR